MTLWMCWPSCRNQFFLDVFFEPGQSDSCLIDQGEKDDKIIAVYADDPEYRHYTDIKELAPHRLMEIKRFFEDCVKVNGYACKEMTNVNEADFFFFAGLAKPGATNNTMGSVVTGANVQRILGLNTLGVSMARIDYAPHGLNPSHTHPRATKIVYVIAVQLEVGFLTTTNRLISKTVKVGEVFVFPKGLVHFQMNNGSVPAVVIAAFNSQLRGTQSLAATLFGVTPTFIIFSAVSPAPDTQPPNNIYF